MDITSNEPAGAFIMRVTGDMRLWGRDRGPDHLINALRAKANLPKTIVLNLAEVKQIDSLGIGALARVLIECGKRELDLRIVQPTGFAAQVLGHLHILDAWPVFPDEAAALQRSIGA